jgi:hypothetical protein
MIGLCDHLREERVERDPALCELLSEDIGFFVNPNLRINLCVTCHLSLSLSCRYLLHNLLICLVFFVADQSLHSKFNLCVSCSSLIDLL